MKAKYKILMIGLIMALFSTVRLWAQEYPREGQRIEQVHARLAELKEAAQQAEREGQPEKATQMREKAKKLAEEIEAFAQKTKGRMPAEAKQRIEQLRDMARQAKERGEMEKASQLWAEAEELERTLKREFESRPEPPEDVRERLKVEKRRSRPMEIEPRREGVRERPEPPGPWANLERMQKEIQDVLAVHLERMANQFRELQMHMERMERELQELRAENMRLKSQLREMPLSRKGPEREFREPGEAIKRQETER